MNAAPPSNLRSALPVLLALAVLAVGCAHYPVNAPLKQVDVGKGYRFHESSSQTNSSELLLMLAFSGGGTRAAALAYGVLEELARTSVGGPGGEHRLLDEVDLISSVSGGSFVAAYYALWGDRIFSDFEPRFLKRNVQSALLWRSLSPWNCVRLASSTFNSSDLAAEYYGRRLFEGATFADLDCGHGPPFLVINATDIALGTRFEFTQDQFDLLGSDLSAFPMGRAVAASSAFPVFLSPVVLKNYSGDAQSTEPEWIREVLTNRTASSRQRNLALQARSYLDGDRRRFIHLLDGGITDNLGLRGSMDRIIASEYPSDSSPHLPLEGTHRIAVIVVDAHAEKDCGWDARERSPRFWELVGSVGRVPISRYSFETIELFKESAERMAREVEAARLAGGVKEGGGLTVYTVALHFSQMTDESDRRFFNSVPTQLHLPPKTVDRLRRIAVSELIGNEEFQRLVGDLRRQEGEVTLTPLARPTADAQGGRQDNP